MSHKTSNHEKAPQCAEFVRRMREAFGAENVTVTYVQEGNFKLGEKAELGSPATAGVGNGVSGAGGQGNRANVPLSRPSEASGADARGNAQKVGEDS